MSSKTLRISITLDGKLAEEVNRRKKEHRRSKAQILRELAYLGLKREKEPQPQKAQPTPA